MVLFFGVEIVEGTHTSHKMISGFKHTYVEEVVVYNNVKLLYTNCNQGS